MRSRGFRSCTAAMAALLRLVAVPPAFGQRRDAPGVQELRDSAPPSLREWIEGLPEAQRRAAVRRLRNMPAKRRARFFQRWDAMDDVERKHFQQRMENRRRAAQERDARAPRDRDRPANDRQALRDRVKEMTPKERRAFQRQLREWNQLDTKKKDGMRRRLKGFRRLSAEDQERMVEERFRGRSAEERRKILEGLRAASRSAR